MPFLFSFSLLAGAVVGTLATQQTSYGGAPDVSPSLQAILNKAHQGPLYTYPTSLTQGIVPVSILQIAERYYLTRYFQKGIHSHNDCKSPVKDTAFPLTLYQIGATSPSTQLFPSELFPLKPMSGSIMEPSI